MPTLDANRLTTIVESADSALGRWTSARWSPPAISPLAGLVDRVWYFDGRLERARERVFPDGSAELIVMLDEVHRDGDAEGLDPFPTVCINGLRTRPSVVIAPSSRCRVLGIRLSPLGACALLRESIDGLLDVTIDVHAALGRDAHRLAERCGDAADVSLWNADRNALAVIDTAVEWLIARLTADHQIDPLLHYAIAEIRGARGTVSLDGMASQLGLSRTRFAQRFRSRFGVTPKRFARIIRFHHALTALGALGSVSQAAAELDYYDQAHMYRDFAEFAGMTPGAFLSATRYPGSASLAEP